MGAKGIARVRLNSKNLIEDILERRTDAGVYALLSQGAALANMYTPVDTSFLINSQYSPVLTRLVGQTSGRVGYLASYAGFVHDKPGTMKGLPRRSGNGDYWDPNAEPGFMDIGFNQLRQHSSRILRSVYGV